MYALNTIETSKAEMKVLKEGTKARRSTSSNGDRRAKVEAPKPPMFNGARDA